ncbi:MAG: TonB-dependent receptor [Opitutus sp.]|nr:TonB-dependent receptor [Opitutus sp.]
MHSAIPPNPTRLASPSSFARCAFAAVAFGLVLPLHGATPSSPPAESLTTHGTIEGRVFNSRSGNTVENARVSIESASLVTFTDADGNYRLTHVPVGTVRLRVFFTGFPPQSDELVVTANGTLQRDLTLAAGKPDSALKKDDKVVQLGEFVVGESREMAGAAIAINEQRFAPNVRNVVSTDEFGAVAEGNVAEFLRYLPGITVDLSGGDARTVSIDGAPAANTPVTLSGLNLSSPTGVGRAVEVGFFNLNNISRIEVSHSPTPDSPGSSLAGSVNMVPRSSFERTRPVFNGSVYLMMRDDLIEFSKTPSLYRDPRRVIHPGADFSWIVPVNKRFGFSVATGASTQYSHQVGHTNAWRGVSAATNGAAFPSTVPGRPYLSAYTVQDAPKESSRDSLGVTLDFKLSHYDRIALSYQYSSFDGWTAPRNVQFNPTQIVAGTFTPTFSQGVAGAGNIVVNSNGGRVRENRTYLPTFTWRHDGPVWKAEGGVGRAYGTNAVRSTDKGMLLTTVSRRTGVTIGFDQIIDTRPGIITVVDNATRTPVDPFKLASYSLDTVTDNPQRASDVNFSAYGNVRRDFFWRVPVTLKSGLEFRQSSKDIRAGAYSYTYRGSTVPGSAAPFLDTYISQRVGPYGFPRMQFADYKETFAYFKANPSQFTLDENANYRALVNGSKFAVEGVSAAYLRGDVALLNRRLLLVGGVRAEQTNVMGQGPLTELSRNVRRDANGRPLLDAAGRPIAITANALEISKLTLLRRAARVEKEYLRFFPSLNASLNLRENLIARAAVSTSIGPPDFNQYAGGLTLPNTDNLPGPANRIVVNNAGIRPWTASTIKLRLEYYFEGVGQFAVGAFRRDFKNFFGNTVFTATPEFLALYGLEPNEFGAYEVSTQHNLPGTVRMEGVDASYKQALTFLPHWARGVQVFGNIAARGSDGRHLGSLDFNEISHNGSWGVSLTRPRFNVRLNVSFRAAQRLGAVTGVGIEPETYNYTPSRNTVDVLGEYMVWKRFAVFANLRNVGDVPNEGSTVGPSTPGPSQLRTRERYGSLWTIGVKGTF